MKNRTLITVGRTLISFGFDPRKILSLSNVPKFVSQKRQFERMGGAVTHYFPALGDYNQQAGFAKGHYFHQDLAVASYIYKNNPSRHIDIGSRIDGFCAHVASFRPIEIMDIRKLNDVGHPNISFIQADLMDSNNTKANLADSISCLHAIEHFGLGRYGDPIDPNGHIKGFNNILHMLKPGGTLYISVPIADKNEVCFNAHRLFNPKDILTWADKKYSLCLVQFDYVDDDGNFHRDFNVEQVPRIIYGCGLYTLRKN